MDSRIYDHNYYTWWQWSQEYMFGYYKDGFGFGDNDVDSNIDGDNEYRFDYNDGNIDSDDELYL